MQIPDVESYCVKIPSIQETAKRKDIKRIGVIRSKKDNFFFHKKKVTTENNISRQNIVIHIPPASLFGSEK